MKYFVYILKSLTDNGYYIGTTNNIKKRLNEHNNGLSKSTKSRKPFTVVYIEKFNNINQAYQREKIIKSKKSKKIIKLIIKSCSPEHEVLRDSVG